MVMAIREILLPLVSYPSMAGEAAIKKAVMVAAHLDAQITAVSFEVNIRLPDDIYARPFITDPLVIETPRHQKSRVNAESLLATFAAAAAASGIKSGRLIQQCTPEELPSSLAIRA